MTVYLLVKEMNGERVEGGRERWFTLGVICCAFEESELDTREEKFKLVCLPSFSRAETICVCVCVCVHK